MLAKSVQTAEPFLKPWISKSNGIATINHPPLVNNPASIVKKSSLPQYKYLFKSSNIGNNPFGGLTRLSGVDGYTSRQSFNALGTTTENLGLTFSLTTLAFSLLASVFSIMMMSAGAAIFPVSYKNAGIRVRTG